MAWKGCPSARPHDAADQHASAIGRADRYRGTVAASRVEIPLESILSADQEATGRPTDGIDIAIGSQGANRTLSLDLGEGVRQHVLIAGKTGSGKEHAAALDHHLGSLSLPPDQLHFYLLDFKKGVEFKPYAESGLPHARVIGIESEREFGRSVLQRLDEELQRRGELFRDAERRKNWRIPQRNRASRCRESCW